MNRLMAVAVVAIAQPRVRILEDDTAARLSFGANKRHQWGGCFPYINMDSISVESDPRKFSVITRIFAKILHCSLGKSASRLLGYSLPLLFDVIPGILLLRKYWIFIISWGKKRAFACIKISCYIALLSSPFFKSKCLRILEAYLYTHGLTVHEDARVSIFQFCARMLYPSRRIDMAEWHEE